MMRYENSYSMSYPTRFVGKIIGRSGSTIKEISQKANANIKVFSNRDTYTEETEIRIFYNDQESLDRAISLIDEVIKPLQSDSAIKYRGRCDDYLNDQEEYYNNSYNNYNNNSSYKPAASSIDWSSVISDSKNAIRQKWAKLAPIKKDFYFESAHIASLTDDEVAKIREAKNNINVFDHVRSEEEVDEAADIELRDSLLGQKIPNPISAFSDAFSNEHYPEILKILSKTNFKEPTPIQCQSWPILLSGRDLIGISQTGSGKTLAFLLPALIHIENQPTPKHKRVGPTCLILSPTRELAKQIEEEVNKFCYHGIRSCCLYGGTSRREQISSVEAGVEIVIATPGRLNDLYMNKIISMDSVSFLVLDEADRMLDMGFEAEIKKVLLDIRPDRQSVMTSATWPPQVRRLAKNYMKFPVQVNIGSLDLTACHTVTQLFEFIDSGDKLGRIKDFLTNEIDAETDKVLIFVGRKVTADYLSTEFSMHDIMQGDVQCIHGDREQCDREQALKEFRDGTVKVLIATDVASRGLDVKDVTLVVNYDFPKHIEEYVHRIGRTGRAGRSGRSLSFMAREDWSHAGDVIKLLKEAEQEVPMKLIAMSERYDEMRRNRDIEGVSNNRFGGGRFNNGGDRRRSGDSRERFDFGNLRNDRGRNNGQQSSNSCFKCGVSGHMARECRN